MQTPPGVPEKISLPATGRGFPAADRVPGEVRLIPLHGIPEIRDGDDLAALLASALPGVGGLQPGDILVVSSKVISKAAGLRTRGRDATAARRELVLEHSTRVVAERATAAGITRIVQAQAGPVMAAAGLDASNTGAEGGVLMLPADPDAAAAQLHSELVRLFPGVPFGVLLSDTAGRPWRDGQTDFALGAHGVQVLDDLRGGHDVDGRDLSVTARALGDEIAAAADLVKGKVAAIPAALVRGVEAGLSTRQGGSSEEDLGARALLRSGPGDWFALGSMEAVRAALGAAPGTPEAMTVGIPSVGPEPRHERIARAIRLALLVEASDVRVIPPPEVALEEADHAEAVRVSSPCALTAGRIAARLEIALAGEGLHDVRVDAHVDSPPQHGPAAK